jgi:hypothetical protein
MLKRAGAKVPVPSLLLLLLLAIPSQTASSEGDFRLEASIERAIQQLGSHEWDGRCQQFVESVYGVTSSFLDPVSMFDSIGTRDAHLEPGVVVVFGPNAANGYHGHAGIYLGEDLMVSATYLGVRYDSISYWSSSIAPLLGYAYPPPSWPGGSRPDSGSPAPSRFSDVHETSVTPGTAVSDDVTLTAS